MTYSLSGKKFIIIIDNDNKSSRRDVGLEKLKDAGLEVTLVNENDIHLYPDQVYSIEHYLLEPRAFRKAMENMVNDMKNEGTL